MDDVLDYTTDVSMALSVVERAELGGVLVQARVGRYSQRLVLVENTHSADRRPVRSRRRKFRFSGGLTEDGATALALVANNSTHGDSLLLEEYLSE